MITNSANLKTFFIGLLTAFNTAFAKNEPQWQEIATRVPSTTREQGYGWLGSFPRIREWIGDRQIKNLAAHDYSIKNKSFEATIGVPREDLEDDTHGVYSVLATELGQSAKEHPDELVFGLLKDGFNSECFDGQNYFDTDHPVGDDGDVVSNMQAGAGAAWFILDTSRGLKPLIFQERKPYKFTAMDNDTDDNVFMRKEYLYGVDSRGNVGFGFWQMAFGSKAELTTANFDDAYDAMRLSKGDSGEPLNIRPTMLVVGPTNRKKAEDIILKEKLAGGGTNTNLNRLKIMEVAWLD